MRQFQHDRQLVGNARKTPDVRHGFALLAYKMASRQSGVLVLIHPLHHGLKGAFPDAHIGI